MKRTFQYILALMALCVATTASAQNLQSAYFLDGYAYGHELNAAKDYDRKSYFSVLPVLSGLDVTFRGSLALKDVLKKNPNGHGLVTYLHPDLSYSEAMDGFSKNNFIAQDLRLNIASVGFHAFKGFNTISINVRENFSFNAPKEMFDMLRKLHNTDYDISDFGGKASAWAEIALGHSHQVTDAIRVGGKFKFLIGLAYGRAKFTNLHLNLEDENRWVARANAQVDVGLKGFTWGDTETKEYKYKKNLDGTPATYEQLNLDNADFDSDQLGIAGKGFAFDLGAEWDLEKQGILDGMKLSLALNDLGFIKWKHMAVAENRGEEFVFEGFQNIQVKDGPGESFDDQTDDIADRLSDLYALQDGGQKSHARGIGATLNIGAEYTLPMYKPVKFGFLSTTRINGEFSWNEERLSVNYAPCKWFDMAVSGGVGTMGGSLGAVINLHRRGFNFFIGSDHCFFKLSKQGVPLRSNASVQMGILFPLGKVRQN